MPILITTLAECAQPRYMTVRGIYEAQEKDITVWGLKKDIEDKLDLSNIGLKGSPTRVKKSFEKKEKLPAYYSKTYPLMKLHKLFLLN